MSIDFSQVLDNLFSFFASVIRSFLHFLDFYFPLIIYRIVIISVILFLTFIVSKIANQLFIKLEKYLAKYSDKSFRFLRHLTIGFIYFLGACFAIITIPSLKGIAFSLLASSGILVAIVGLASQQAFSNIISGLFLDIFSPFKIGDEISVKNITGKVTDITLRHTIIKTIENKIFIVPNSVMNKETIENLSR